jgi:hypothetical protein
MEQVKMNTKTLKIGMQSLFETFWAIGTSAAAAGVLVNNCKILNVWK